MKLTAIMIMALIVPASLSGQEARVEFVQTEAGSTSSPQAHHHKPHNPTPEPQPPVVLPTPQVSPVAPVWPTTGGCYYIVQSTPVAPVPCWTYGPVGYYPVPRGCGSTSLTTGGFHPFRAIGRVLFGRCR